MNQSNPTSRVFISRTGWYSFAYPAHWSVDENEDSVAAFDPENGVGAVHISAYQTPAEVDSKAELLEQLSDSVPAFDPQQVRTNVSGSKNVSSFNYRDGGNFHQIWFIGDGHYLLLANYICDSKDVGRELAQVEDIIGSVEVEPKLSRN